MGSSKIALGGARLLERLIIPRIRAGLRIRGHLCEKFEDGKRKNLGRNRTFRKARSWLKEEKPAGNGIGEKERASRTGHGMTGILRRRVFDGELRWEST